MQGILDFLQGIADGFTSVIDFIISMFEDLVYVVQLTGKFLASIPDYFSWLPSGVLALLVTIFGIVVVYKILGREG